MNRLVLDVFGCIRHAHDQRLLLLAAVVCACGIYASIAIASHAARSDRGARRPWAPISIVSAGCTAWATHFIILLAFEPRVPAAFDPLLTIISALCAIGGIGAGMTLSLRERRPHRRFAAGLVLGSGIALLHYVGQAAYLVEGIVAWDKRLVLASVLLGVPMCGFALLVTGSRNRPLRYLASPLLLGAIAVLHFCGMAAMHIHADSTRLLPAGSVAPATITPVVAGVSLALLALAVIGMRFEIAARARQRWERKRLGELAGVALEGLLICDGDQITVANSSMERLASARRGELVGSSISVLLPGLDVASIPEREERDAELELSTGELVPVRALRSEVRIGRKQQTVVAVRDQRERLRAEARMRTLAFNDALTGLLNRARFMDLLARQATSQRDADAVYAVLMIDLDRFKHVNDTLGHSTGDLLLRKVADRLGATAREGDVIARLGGDEFAILLLAADSDEAGRLAGRIVERIGEHPFLLDDQVVYIGASIGIASSPFDGDEPAELLRHADLALYAAKADGKSRYRHYDSALNAASVERRILEEGLRNAIANDELELFYQPLLDTHSGRITSAEALLRWKHPDRGLISPVDFITLAEETGLILPLGEWVIRTACREAAGWPDDINVAINLSPVQFRDTCLAATIEAALAVTGLEPHRLELEITEGVLLTDEDQTLATLTRLKAQGLRISMDDFGTGYSSLSYLRRFPFDKIKIDQSFVRQAPHDGECAAIVRAIITMGRCLGMATTVEGVETGEQFAFSVGQGCDAVQGYYVSKPLSATDFSAFRQDWVADHSLRTAALTLISHFQDNGMIPAPTSAEVTRLDTLRGYGVLDTPNEPAFDAIVRKARSALQVPIVLVSLVDEDRQWFKARVGLDVAETPRCISFCTHALFRSDMLIIPDARQDERFATNPLVTGAPHIRFYAGAPLKAPNGSRIGTLCAIDTRPRSGLTDSQIAAMERLAAQTIEALEQRRSVRSAQGVVEHQGILTAA